MECLHISIIHLSISIYKLQKQNLKKTTHTEELTSSDSFTGETYKITKYSRIESHCNIIHLVYRDVIKRECCVTFPNNMD